MTNYYVRATGPNQKAGGTARWLKIRGIRRGHEEFRIEVLLQGRIAYIGLIDNPHHLEFAKGKWPNVQLCSWSVVKEGFNVKAS